MSYGRELCKRVVNPGMGIILYNIVFTNKSLTRASANHYNNDIMLSSVCRRYWTGTLIDLGLEPKAEELVVLPQNLYIYIHSRIPRLLDN